MNATNNIKVISYYETIQGHTEYLLNKLLPKRGIGVLHGATGSGKTLAATQIALTVASGGCLAKFHGGHYELGLNHAKTKNKGATLYFAGEGQANIINRIKAANSGFENSIPANVKPIIVITKSGGRLHEATDLFDVDNAVRAQTEYLRNQGYPIRLIIFDTLSASFEIQDENNNSEMERIVQALKAYADLYACFVLVVAHPPKSHSSDKNYTRGASALVNASDVVLKMEKRSNKVGRVLTVTKMRDGPSEGAKAYFRIETINDQPVLVSDAANNDEIVVSKDKYEQLIIAHLEQANLQTKSEIIAHMKLSQTKKQLSKKNIKDNTVEKGTRFALEKMIASGTLYLSDQDQYSLTAAKLKSHFGGLSISAPPNQQNF